MDKEQRQKRFQQKQRHVERQAVLSRTFFGFVHKDQPHRYAKKSFCSCGNPNCVMCMNPRKLGDVTIQEQKQEEYANSFKFDTGVYDEQSE